MSEIWTELAALLSADRATVTRLGSFFGLVLLGLFAHAVAFRTILRYAERGDTRHFARFIAGLKWPTRLLALAIAIGLAVPLLDLPPSFLVPAKRVSHLLTVFATAWALFRLVAFVQNLAKREYPIDIEDNLSNRRNRTQITILARIAMVAIVIVSGAIMLMSIPAVRELGVSLLASAGIAGLAIGMAARPALSNIIAGVQIALTQPIRIDDVVIVEGEWGWIEEIATTYVVVRIWDQRRLIVPLSYFIEHPFENWTRQTAEILGTVFLYADYTLPVDDLRKKFEEVTAASKYWDKRVCVLHVTEAKEQTMELRLLVSAATSPRAWELRCEIREKMIAWLQTQHPDALPRARVELHGDRPDVSAQ